jgi:hypothetical protein
MLLEYLFLGLKSYSCKNCFRSFYKSHILIGWANITLIFFYFVILFFFFFLGIFLFFFT